MIYLGSESKNQLKSMYRAIESDSQRHAWHRLMDKVSPKDSKKYHDISLWRTSQGKWENPSKLLWVHIGPGYMYLSYRKGRSYWILNRILPVYRPEFKFDDQEQLVKFGTYKIKFNKSGDYNRIKHQLQPFSKGLSLAEARNLIKN